MSSLDNEILKNQGLEFHSITKITQKCQQIYLDIPKVAANFFHCVILQIFVLEVGNHSGNARPITYIITRSTITKLIGKGETKGDFNIFKKEGSIHLHDHNPKQKLIVKASEGKRLPSICFPNRARL